VSQPISTGTGDTLQAFSIQINNGGNIEATAVDLVTIGLVGGDGLMGTISKNAVAGVVVFDSI